MSFLKSKLNLLNFAVVATTLSFVPALAAANPPVESPDKKEIDIAPAAPVPSGFQSADLNVDGVLDMSEFSLYAGNQAVAGDSDFTAIVSSGDYENAFQLLDADASGSLSLDEVMGEDDDIDDNMTSKDEMELKAE